MNHFVVGDRVKCTNSMSGICRFIGTIHNKQGIWVGIDLADEPLWHGKGKNSGTVNGTVYFQCQPNCGIFFPISKVSAASNNSRIRRQSSATTTTSTPRPKLRPSLPPPIPSSTIPRQQPLTRKPSTIKQQQQEPTISPLKRSSHLPPTTTTTTAQQQPTSITTKRPESVNSHHARTATPDWARQSSSSRRKSISRFSSSTQTIESKPSSEQQQVIIETLQLQLKEKEVEYKKREEEHTQQLETNLKQSNLALEQAKLDNTLKIDQLKQELETQHQQQLNQLQEQLTTLNQSLQLTQDTSTQQSLQFEREKTDLSNQLHQLRSAGQSLCGVYENKISNLEELRLNQQRESELIAEELKLTKQQVEELKQQQQQQQPKEEEKIKDTNITIDNSNLQAIEIDNESLRADLKYTQERLSEVQDEAYQLKQELNNQRELHDQLVQRHEETLQQHIITINTTKDELTILDKEKSNLQDKLTQVETRLKETLETMEQERVELEGLRADVLASSSHPHPLPFTQAASSSELQSSTLTHTATPPKEPEDSSEQHICKNLKQDQLESELKEKESRIHFLENQLEKLQPTTTLDDHNTLNLVEHQDVIMDQEKMLVIQKYQRLLLAKDEENLKLINQLEQLQEQLDHRPHHPNNNNNNPHFPSPSRGTTTSYDWSSSPRLRHKTSTSSLWRDDSPLNPSPRPTTVSRSFSCKTTDQLQQGSARELAKANQQIIGLKLIARQSDDERGKYEKANLELKQEIEELKQDNRLLEQKLATLIKSGQVKIMGLNRKRSETMGQRYSLLGLGLDNEIGLANENKPMPPSTTTTTTPTTTMTTTTTSGATTSNEPQTGEIVIGDYKKVKKLELEIDQLKSQLAFLEQKHAREVTALNKEVSELESIIESKIFQEEELEEEIQQLNERLSRPGGPTVTRTVQRSRSIRSYSGGNGAELQRRNSVVSRRRPLELGGGSPQQQQQQQPTTSRGLRGFVGMNGVEEGEEEEPEGGGAHHHHHLQLPSHPTPRHHHLPKLHLPISPPPALSPQEVLISHHTLASLNEACELCDRPGHQLDSCPIFSPDS